MGFGKSIQNVTHGADLTHPRLSLGWVLPAIVAIVILLAVVAIAKWGFTKVSAPVKSVLGNVPVVGSVATQTPADTMGWIY